MSGGIIIQRANVLLIAITDPCLYNSLSDDLKSRVDSVDAKDPASRTEADVKLLSQAIAHAVGC